MKTIGEYWNLGQGKWGKLIRKTENRVDLKDYFFDIFVEF